MLGNDLTYVPRQQLPYPYVNILGQAPVPQCTHFRKYQFLGSKTLRLMLILPMCKLEYTRDCHNSVSRVIIFTGYLQHTTPAIATGDSRPHTEPIHRDADDFF